MKISRCIHPVVAWALFGSGAFAGEFRQKVPRLVDLVYGTKDLVPVVSFDVSAAPYSADKTGKKDCTKSFSAALSDAASVGGTVFAPAGYYRIDGVLCVPSGVTLRGDWKEPTESDARVAGTVLLAYAGRGSVEGDPFLDVEGGVRDLSVFYPEQKPDNVALYPVTFDLTDGSSIKNITLVNSYRGVLTGSFSIVMNLYATTLDTGITMLNAVAVPRCRDIHLSPRYWSESGAKGAPEYGRLRKIMVDRQAHGIQLNRQDAGIFIDVAIEGYHTGLKFMPPHGWTYWHNLRIRDVEVGIHFTGGSDHRASMTGSSISASRYAVLMKMDQTGWNPDWTKISKSGKPFGTKRDEGCLRMFGCRLESAGTDVFMDGSFTQKIDLQECTFAQWGDGNDNAAIAGEVYDLTAYDCIFQKSSRHVRLKGNPHDIELVGNQFKGKPDIQMPYLKAAKIDHAPARDSGRSINPIQPIPNMLPARTDKNSLYVATATPFKAPSDGIGDASAGIQSALDRAGKDGGGTVYLPQGSYRLTKHLKVPPGVELRGINDFMPHGTQVRTLLVADLPDDRGKSGNPPLISLDSSKELGGSGVAGLGIWYPHQDYREFSAYPWTIQGLGPACWIQRVYLGNCYDAIDFATHDNDRHVLSGVCGSALHTAFFVGHSATIGWIDNCHIRPQDWALAASKKNKSGYVFDIPGDQYSKPTKEDIFRGTPYSLIPNLRGAGVITVGSGANEQVTAFFSNGATRAFDFVDSDGSGGGNANVLIGGSEAGWGAWIKQLGPKGLTIINFSFNPMTRLSYVKPDMIPVGQLPKGMAMRIDEAVSKNTPITMILPKLYGSKEVDLGIDMRGGDVLFKQGQIGDYNRSAIKVGGGKLTQRNTHMAENMVDSSD